MKLMKMFPRNKSIPPDQEGYERDANNPYIFRMKWVPCVARENKELCRGCTGSIISHFCTFYKKEVDQNGCKACGGIEVATERHSIKLELCTERLSAESRPDSQPDIQPMPTPDSGDEENNESPEVQKEPINVVLQKIRF